MNNSRSNRSIDALVISIGGNDIGLTTILAGCLIAGATNPLQNCNNAEVQLGIRTVVQIALTNLGNRLDRLAACIGTKPALPLPCDGSRFLGVRADHVFLMAYPDPARGDAGALCSGLPLGADAWGFAETQILAPLDQLLQSKAHAYGWNVAGEQPGNLLVVDYNGSTEYPSHGYCATDTWLRPFTNNPNHPVPDEQNGSYFIQGDRNGILHPNHEGHDRMGKTLKSAIEAKLYGSS